MIIKDQIIRRQRYPRNLSFQYACFEQQLTKNKKILQNINQFSQSQNQISPKHQNCFTPIIQITPTNEIRSRLMSYQNDYANIAAKKHTLCDERKLLIKEKIKIKVKEKFEETLKNNESFPTDQKVSEMKKQSISSQIYDVKVKGEAMKRSQRSIFSYRRQNSKPLKLSNIKKRIKSEFRQKKKDQKFQAINCSPRYKSSVGISAAKAIKLRDVAPKKFKRKIHSALDELFILPNKSSFQIDPWNSAEDF